MTYKKFSLTSVCHNEKHCDSGRDLPKTFDFKRRLDTDGIVGSSLNDPYS